MAITEIIHFGVQPVLDAHPSQTTVDDTFQKAAKALGEAKTPLRFAVGTQIQNQGAVQITSEWDGDQDSVNIENTPERDSFLQSVRSFFGEPCSIFHVTLDRSAFGADGPATANVVEFVQTFFPSSRVTPEFQKQIEEDFLRFDEIYKEGAKGSLSWACGWVLEEQDHENIGGEKAKSFFVTRGWESMKHFEQSVNNHAYKTAIPLLLAWNAPWKMWHVERKP